MEKQYRTQFERLQELIKKDKVETKWYRKFWNLFKKMITGERTGKINYKIFKENNNGK